MRPYLERLLIGATVVFLWWLLAVLRRLLRQDRNTADRRYRESNHTCARVPDAVYQRPDPLIYSQGYLMSQGLAVTWDNPDIHLELAGVPVDSSSLTPSTEYDIVARVWNGSNRAPAIDLPVKFSYLEFGIATVSHPIGQLGDVRVDLQVRGAPGLPAIARHTWRTPAASGHYCIQVELLWADDANPANNVGQENLVVKKLNSPRATFLFPVRNDARWERVLRLRADAYQLPAPVPCAERPRAATPEIPKGERQERQRETLRRHAADRFAVPSGWIVAMTPSEFRLVAGAQQEVTVDITAPDGFVGEQTLNVNAFDERDVLVGGVTLKVHS